jgi:hypothetical protein
MVVAVMIGRIKRVTQTNLGEISGYHSGECEDESSGMLRRREFSVGKDFEGDSLFEGLISAWRD